MIKIFKSKFCYGINQSLHHIKNYKYLNILLNKAKKKKRFISHLHKILGFDSLKLIIYNLHLFIIALNTTNNQNKTITKTKNKQKQKQTKNKNNKKTLSGYSPLKVFFVLFCFVFLFLFLFFFKCLLAQFVLSKST